VEEGLVERENNTFKAADLSDYSGSYMKKGACPSLSLIK
jgi:hypothetical protein